MGGASDPIGDQLRGNAQDAEDRGACRNAPQRDQGHGHDATRRTPGIQPVETEDILLDGQQDSTELRAHADGRGSCLVPLWQLHGGGRRVRHWSDQRLLLQVWRLGPCSSRVCHPCEGKRGTGERERKGKEQGQRLRGRRQAQRQGQRWLPRHLLEVRKGGPQVSRMPAGRSGRRGGRRGGGRWRGPSGHRVACWGR